MNLKDFMTVFGVIVLGMILVFLAAGGGQQVGTAATGLAGAGGTFFKGFQQAV